MTTDQPNTTKRQAALARHIGQTYCKTDRLIPLGRHSSLSVPPIPLQLEVWAAERLCDIAWWVVAKHLGRIDHAWLFGISDAPHEPWGFVTEPYINTTDAIATIHAASEAMPEHEWGIEFYALGSDQGSWNPPGCIPIVAISRNFTRLILKTVPIALGLEVETEIDV